MTPVVKLFSDKNVYISLKDKMDLRTIELYNFSGSLFKC